MNKKTVAGGADLAAQVAIKVDLDVQLLYVFVHLVDGTGEVAVRAHRAGVHLDDLGADDGIALAVIPHHWTAYTVFSLSI